jgi:hypothetical protein
MGAFNDAVLTIRRRRSGCVVLHDVKVRILDWRNRDRDGQSDCQSSQHAISHVYVAAPGEA